MDDNIILEYFKDKRKINWKFINVEIKEYLQYRYSDSESLLESYFRIKYNIEQRPKCSICGGDVKFIGKPNKIFNLHCSKRCSSLDKNVQNKQKQTKLSKYDDYNYNNREKNKQTCLERYGIINGGGTKESIQKIKQTCLERYNNPNYNNYRKHQQTCLERYGNQSWSSTNIGKKILSNKSKIFYNSDKGKLTLLNIFKTKKENETYKKSKEEDLSYELLKEKFSDIIRQYKSDIYPFACDFYIPSLDLYIECNYHWTHGGKLYEGTKEDNIKLNKWKEKNTKYYDNAIKTWIYYDVKKNQIAKENKLKYLLFYNINELKKWLNKNG